MSAGQCSGTESECKLQAAAHHHVHPTGFWERDIFPCPLQDSFTPTTNIESLVLPLSTTPFFYLSHLSIEYPKNFSFISFHLFIFGLNACATRIMFIKSHPWSVSSRIFPSFSSYHTQGFESYVVVLNPFGVEFV